MKESQATAPEETTGVLETTEIANFQDVNDASGSNPVPDSIPAFVKEQGRLLLVPEFSVERLENRETQPREQRVLQNGADNEGVNTALIADATTLTPAATSAASVATPTM